MVPHHTAYDPIIERMVNPRNSAGRQHDLLQRVHPHLEQSASLVRRHKPRQMASHHSLQSLAELPKRQILGSRDKLQGIIGACRWLLVMRLVIF